jgi:hypothetical protein
MISDNERMSSPKRTSDHEKGSTLPNPSQGAISIGSVMYADPHFLGQLPLGARSAGTQDDVAAIGVPRVDDAKQRLALGAAIAVNTSSPRQWHTADIDATESVGVIERDFGDDNVTQTIGDLFNDIVRLSDAEAFEIVKQGRDLLAWDKASRVARKDTDPGAATLTTYAKKCQLIDAAIEANPEPIGDPISTALSKYAHNNRSFSVMRAALKHRAIKHVTELLQEQDSIQRAEKQSPSWKTCVDQLKLAVHELKQIQMQSQEQCLVLSGRTVARSRSKKSILRLLKPNWREKFLEANESSPTYRAAGVLMRHCGFRPEELERGVHVELKGEQMLISINGAKVRDTAGQPWRKFALQTKLLPPWFVEEVAQKGSNTYQADKDNMRAHLTRLSAILYPREKDKEPVILSAYVFRHALVTEMRSRGWDTSDIAAVIGESCSATTRHYGDRWPTGSGQLGSIAISRNSIQTARPVAPPDTSWLKSKRPSKKIGAQSPS